MAARRRPARADDQEQDLFTVDPSFIAERLARHWPDPARLPVNHAAATVRSYVWPDLTSSASPLVVAGYSALALLVDLVAAWDQHGHAGPARLLVGSEPFVSDRVSFESANAAFTNEARQYWQNEGVSLRLSAKIVRALQLLDAGRVQARFLHGSRRLHAKIYLGDGAVTVGSSNFTDPGLRTQLEANVRFTRNSEPDRYAEVAQAAESYWAMAEAWDQELAELLHGLLRFTSWQEALARACADLLDGQWASGYLSRGSQVALWPSQRTGIAQALWVVENVGSVLVADATGSGKTRMGAHLARAVRDRLWSTGRVRGDLTVLVCPPQVTDTWMRESVRCGLTVLPVSQGLLSRPAPDGPRAEEEAVHGAQILAVDEAHNFLRPLANRTRHLRASAADHVLLFTATPINRGASDLLQLVDLLGADNFDEEALRILDRLDRRGPSSQSLTPSQQHLLQQEIQRFTVRRTKAALNAMVDADPDSYKDPSTGRTCRYPRHRPHAYDTNETADDRAAADEIRQIAGSMRGLAQLGRKLEVPDLLRGEYTDEKWLQMRLTSARGLAAHHLLSAMRSSTAALLEHVVGTDAATTALGLSGYAKPQSTGDMVSRLAEAAEAGPPTSALKCALPEWLTDADAWSAACRAEAAHYEAIGRLAHCLSGAREQGKADLLLRLSRQHPRVLAFDRHLITLSVLRSLLQESGVTVVLATGSDAAARKQVQRAFARDAIGNAIALCSDALSEGLNLQGASAVVHLDLPTTLRAAEQRIGRADRMDSPFDQIEAWWPRDGSSFATRANELLVARATESQALLGANLVVPDLRPGSTEVVDVSTHIAHLEDRAATWDGIRDALEPVRGLVHGPSALISPGQYQAYRGSHERVLARVSALDTPQPWAFIAVSGTRHGAPRWLLLEGPTGQLVTGLDAVADRLRHHLASNPPSRSFDGPCAHWLDVFLTRAQDLEHQLLPRRHQRALEQMARVTTDWAAADHLRGHDSDAERWKRLAMLARPGPDDERADPYQIAEIWLVLIQPYLETARRRRRRRRSYVRLRDIDGDLAANPMSISDVQRAYADLPALEPIDRRVSACIVGAPDDW